MAVKCKVIFARDKETGKINKNEIKLVKAPNGNRSLLFDGIKSMIGDDMTSLKEYSKIYTDEFKKEFGDWKVKKLNNTDDNGEPTISAFEGISEIKVNSIDQYLKVNRKTFRQESAVTENLEKLLNGLSKKTSIKYAIVNEPSSQDAWAGKYRMDGVIEINEAYVHQHPDAPFHEFFHPVMDVIKVKNKPLFTALTKQVDSILNGKRKVDEKARKRLQRVRNDGEYVGEDGELTEHGYKEAITELVGAYAAGLLTSPEDSNLTKYNRELENKRKGLMQKLFEYIKGLLLGIKGVAREGENYKVNIQALGVDTSISDLALLLKADEIIININPVRQSNNIDQYKKVTGASINESIYADTDNYSDQQRAFIKNYNEMTAPLTGRTFAVPIEKIKNKLKRELLAMKGDTTMLYELEDGGFVEGRVSHAQDVKFLKNLTKDQAKAREENPFSQLARKMGTELHNVNEMILVDLASMFPGYDHMKMIYDDPEMWTDSKIDEFKKKSTFYQKMKKEIEGGKSIFQRATSTYKNKTSVINEGVQNLDALVKSMMDLYYQVYKVQAGINNEYNKANPKEDDVHHLPIIMLEKILYDKEADEAGTMDIFAKFSDDTGAIYDHKFIRMQMHWNEKITDKEVRKRQGLVVPKGKTKKKFKGAFVLEDTDELKAKMMYKEESYDMQLSRYTQMLMQKYGIKRVRQARIIPVNVQYTKHDLGKKSDTGKVIKEYSLEKSQVRFLMTSRRDHELLNQIPISIEYTGDSQLDRFLERLMTQKNKLKKEFIKKGRRDLKLKDRIEKLDKSIKKIQLDRSIDYVIDSIKTLTKVIDQSLKELKFLDDGELNPRWITLNTIQDYQKEIDTYDMLIRAAANIIDDKKKEGEKEFNDFLNKLGAPMTLLKTMETSLKGRVINLLRDVNDENQFMTENKFESFTSEADISTVSKHMAHLSDINHPLVAMFKKSLDLVTYNRIQAEKKMSRTIEKKVAGLKEWGKSKGLSGTDIYGPLLNKKKNLIGRWNQKFYDDMQTYGKESTPANVSWMQANFHRDAAAEKRFQTTKKKQEAYYKKLYKEDFDKRWETWQNYNDIKFNGGDNRAWFNRFAAKEPKNPDKYYDERYAELLKPENKVALDFYHWYQDTNYKLNNMVDFRIKNNFVAEIHRDMIDTIVQENMASTSLVKHWWNTVKGSWKYRESDDMIDIGEDKHVPIMFMDSINPDNKSIDLGKSMMIFSSYVNTYAGLKEVEGLATSVKDLIKDTPLVKTDLWGRKKRKPDLSLIAEQKDNSNLLSLVENMTNYYVYGEKLSDQSTKLLGPQGTKVVTKALAITSKKNLAFNALSAAAGHMGAKAQIRMMTSHGRYFTQKQANFARMKYTKFNKEAAFASAFFEVSQEVLTHEKANLVSASSMRRRMENDKAYFMQRWSDDAIDNTLLIAMMQNYGIDPETGDVSRLEKLKKKYDARSPLPQDIEAKMNTLEKMLEDEKIGVDEFNEQRREILGDKYSKYSKGFQWKSLWDGIILKDGDEPSTIVDSDGKEIQKRGWIGFRTKVKKVAGKVKGNMSDEDIAGYRTSLIGRLFMQYRGWMPAMVRDRFKGGHYDMTMEEFEKGRYVAIVHALNAQGIKAWGKFFFGVLPFMSGKFDYSDNEQMKARYDQWKLDNSGDDVSYDDFVQEHLRQLKAGAKELQMYLLVLAAMYAIWFAAGDEEKKKNPLVRGTVALLDRAALEVGFFIPVVGINEQLQLVTRSPVPSFSILKDVKNTLTNTFEETSDILSGTPWGKTREWWSIGEDSWQLEYGQVKTDRDGLFKHTAAWVPGVKGASNMTGIFAPESKERDTLWDWVYTAF